MNRPIFCESRVQEPPMREDGLTPRMLVIHFTQSEGYSAGERLFPLHLPIDDAIESPRDLADHLRDLATWLDARSSPELAPEVSAPAWYNVGPVSSAPAWYNVGPVSR